MVLVESTDELGNDLAGIVQLQRRLGGLQRDMAAIEAKVGHLDNQVRNKNYTYARNPRIYCKLIQ